MVKKMIRKIQTVFEDRCIVPKVYKYTTIF